MRRFLMLAPIAATMACSPAMADNAPASAPAPVSQAVAQSLAPSVAAMLPARTLHCTLGRALNLDPSKPQTVADIQHEGAYKFDLFLPSIPAHAGPPPEPTADPEPVDPRTRVLSDPEGIAADMQPQFYRVVDMWPQRVEMLGMVESPMVRLIIVSDVDLAKGTANLFTTRAVDAASIDLDKVFQGGCTIEFGPADAPPK